MIRSSTIKIIFILSLAASTLLGEAKGNNFDGNSVIPIEWQAIRLQENIEEKIKRSLLAIIRPEDYVIEVKIGIDTEKAEEPTPKKITTNIERKKTKYSTALAPKDGDDFVVFNKMGLEAPIVGEEPVETKTSEVELAQRAMIEMNDRYNLFNYLTTIDINLTFDKSLSAKAKEGIQKVVSGLSFNTKDIIPQINTQYVELKIVKNEAELLKTAAANASNKNEKNATKEKDSFFDRFKNLDIMIGLITAALLIAGTMILIARKGSKIEEESKANNENADEVNAENDETHPDDLPQDSDEDEQLEGEDMSVDLTKTDPMTMKIVEGLDRFRKILDGHSNDMALMLKGWIKIRKNNEVNALRALVQILSDKELTKIFECLNIDERATWKMCMGEELNKEELSKSFYFISNQIIQMMMVPSLIDDYEICDLLLALRAEDAAKFAENNIQLGVVFANVLSAKTIGQMFELLPVDISSQIIEESTFFKKEDILAKMPLLKEKMLEFKARRERPPFIKRILDILPTAKPQLEKKLYSTLLRHLPIEEVRDLAVSIFPSDLLGTLPDSVYKESIDKMPVENQVQYFASLSDEERDAGLNRFAAKGSKKREMVEMELSATLKNEVLVARIRSEKKEKLEIEFLGFVRAYLAQATGAEKEVIGTVENWLKEITEDVNPAQTNVKRSA